MKYGRLMSNVCIASLVIKVGFSARMGWEQALLETSEGVRTASAQTGDLDCLDFTTQAEAQQVYDEDTSDPNLLDDDSDGVFPVRNSKVVRRIALKSRKTVPQGISTTRRPQHSRRHAGVISSMPEVLRAGPFR